MTRKTLTRFLAIGAVALGGLGLTAASASASTTHPLRFKPEFFAIQIHNDHSQVEAFGPVRGFGTDQTVGTSGTLDVLVLNHPHGTANVFHTKIGDPKVNLKSCTAFLYENGRWAILGGTGADRHAFGFGRFQLTERVVLQRDHYGKCEPRKDPRSVDVRVTAEGQALVLRHDQHAPALSPALTPVS